MAGEIFYPPPQPVQPVPHVPIPAQGQQPPRRTWSLMMSVVLASHPTGLEYQAPQRAPTVPIPAQGDQPPRYSVNPLMRFVRSWDPPDPQPQQRPTTAPIAPPLLNQPPPRSLVVLGTIIDSWRPPAPQPWQRSPTVPIPAQGDQPPRLRPPLPYSLWVVEPPLPQPMEQTAAVIPTVAASVPFARSLSVIIASWDVADPIRQRAVTFPIRAQGQQPTPCRDYRLAVLDHWIEYPWPQQKAVRVPPPEVPPLTAFPAIIDAPPRLLAFYSPTRRLGFDAPPRTLDFDAPSDRGNR